MTEPTTSGSGLARVRVGMKVVDSAGEDVGKVRSVRMGDPDAITADGQDVYSLREDGVPEGNEERLARLGYAKIDAKGWFTGMRFATGEEVGQVSDDVVHLTVPKDGLLH